MLQTMTVCGELKSVPTHSGFLGEAQDKTLSDLFKYFSRMYKVEISRSNQFGLTASPSNPTVAILDINPE